jgi:hypothetical protein
MRCPDSSVFQEREVPGSAGFQPALEENYWFQVPPGWRRSQEFIRCQSVGETPYAVMQFLYGSDFFFDVMDLQQDATSS